MKMSIELEWIVDQYYNKIQYNKFSNIRNSRERLAQIIFLNNTTSDPYINGLTLLPPSLLGLCINSAVQPCQWICTAPHSRSS